MKYKILDLTCMLQVACVFTWSQSSPSCSGALLILEHGKLAGAVWEQRTPAQVHTHVVLMQSMSVDSIISLRPDQTASKSSTILEMAGDKPSTPKEHALGEGAIYWS